MFGSYIGLMGVGIGLVALFFFVRLVRKMRGNLQQDFIPFLFAMAAGLLFAAFVFIFSLEPVRMHEQIWNIIPALYVITAIPFILGTRNIVVLAKKHTRQSV